MFVATDNIRDNPDLPRWKVRASAAALKFVGDVAFFQEIGEVEDHVDIAAALGKGWSWVGQHLPIPIGYKHRNWELLEHGDELMHHGLARTSPNRYINWAVLRRKRRIRRGAAKKQRIICFLNTHFVSGAWNSKLKTNKEWRKTQWEIHWHKMQQKVQHFIDRGISVIFGGDFNRLHVQPFHSAQRWLVQHGIDKIGYVPAPEGTQIRKTISTGHKDTPSDHDLAWAHLLLEAA